MQTIYQPDKPAPILIAEIQYLMAFSAVKKLVREKNISLETALKMNELLAQQYGVRSYPL